MKNRTAHIIYIFFMCCLLRNTKASGQIMEWVIQPSYKNIVCMGKNLYKVKNANGKWGVYNTSTNNMTVPVEYDNIGPLVEERSLILDVQGERLYGIIDEQGSPVSQLVPASQRPDFAVMKEYPYYSDGLLVVGQPSGQYYNYGYVDKQGNQKVPFKFLYACPFNNGQAMVYNTNRNYQIIDNGGNSQYRGNEKIDFMSNPKNGVFILVTKSRLGDRISKARLKDYKFVDLEDIEEKQKINVADATINKSIYCSNIGKTYQFNNAFHLIEGNAPSVVSPVKTINESNGSLKKEKNGGLYGINYNNNPVLIEQFKDVKVYDDEYAIVTMKNNMVGLLRFNPSGKISIGASSTTIEFSHNQEAVVPVDISCNNTMSQPTFELTVVGDNINKTYKRQGPGRIEIPFYESHNQIGEPTNKELVLELTSDNLKLGRKNISITSKHKAGFSISISEFPEYSSQNGTAKISIAINSVDGPPSNSAFVTVNGGEKLYFKGETTLTTSVSYKISPGETKNCSINVVVSENGCPTIQRSKSGYIKSYNLL